MTPQSSSPHFLGSRRSPGTMYRICVKHERQHEDKRSIAAQWACSMEQAACHPPPPAAPCAASPGCGLQASAPSASGARHPPAAIGNMAFSSQMARHANSSPCVSTGLHVSWPGAGSAAGCAPRFCPHRLCGQVARQHVDEEVACCRLQQVLRGHQLCQGGGVGEESSP